MAAPTDVRSRLQTLSIPKEQRPATTAGGYGAGRGRSRGGGLLLIVLLAAGGAAGYAGRDQIRRLWAPVEAASKMRFETVSLSQEPRAGAVLTATGKIVSDHLVQVATKVSGQIVALHFEQGDRVEKGQTLARIEDVLYRARRDEAAARLVQSQANLEYQKVNFDRVMELFHEQSAQPIEFSDAKRWLSDAEARVAADQAALTFAQKALDDTQVVAPIAGVILTREVEVGDFVAAEGGRGANANSQFATIADMSKLRVEVDISELDIVRVHKEMPCTITPDAYKDRRYRGQVLWIDPGANYSKATVQTKVRINDPDDFLRVEGSAQVEFLEDKEDSSGPSARPKAIWIPVTAVQGLDLPKPNVFLVEEGRLRLLPVKLGRRRGNQVEVLQGLAEGQSFVAEGTNGLRDGQRVSD
jgi:RND family efflux transporter MFP subunit